MQQRLHRLELPSTAILGCRKSAAGLRFGSIIATGSAGWSLKPLAGGLYPGGWTQGPAIACKKSTMGTWITNLLLIAQETQPAPWTRS